MSRDPLIIGGADEALTAAITAVVTKLLDDEGRARRQPPAAPQQSPWVLAWRPREVPVALPSQQYEATAWAELEAAEDIGPE